MDSNARALAIWWSSMELGSGTSTAGRPAAASSDHGGSAGARDQQMRLAQPLRHVLEERLQVHGQAERAIVLLRARNVLGARLLRDGKAVAQLLRQQRDRFRHRPAEHARAERPPITNRRTGPPACGAA